MSEVVFYHLTTTPLEQALPKLLEKTLEKGMRAVIVSHDDKKLASLDAHLWTYRRESFLPHGLTNEPHAEKQPILLSNKITRINNPQFCFLIGQEELPDNLSDFSRILLLFSGEDPDELDHARSIWKSLKEKNIEATYYKQSPEGGWIKP